MEQCARGEVTLVVSAAMLRELERAPQAVRDVLGALGDLPEVLEATTDEIRSLADRYIESGALSEKMRSDAEHIAAATVAGVDVLASWNFRHMVNVSETNPAVQRGEPANGVPPDGHQEPEGA